MSVTVDGFTRLGMLGEAVLSEDGAYRYALARRWDRSLLSLPWIMLNPSTADEKTDDATIIRCMEHARRAGYGGIDVFNLFALRATDPGKLRAHPDPVGPENDKWLAGLVAGTGSGAVPVVVAWGVLPGALRGRDVTVWEILDGCRALCLGKTRDGYPRHPGRLGYDVPFQSFTGLSRGATTCHSGRCRARLGLPDTTGGERVMAGLIIGINGDGTLNISGRRFTRDEVLLGDNFTDREKRFIMPYFDESDAYKYVCKVLAATA